LCRHIWLASTQHLNFHFNPAGLLSVGDAMSFVKGLTAEQLTASEAPLPGVLLGDTINLMTGRG
jgi:hypothetical protein